jgi:hypothetical protein
MTTEYANYNQCMDDCLLCNWQTGHSDCHYDPVCATDCRNMFPTALQLDEMSYSTMQMLNYATQLPPSFLGQRTSNTTVSDMWYAHQGAPGNPGRNVMVPTQLSYTNGGFCNQACLNRGNSADTCCDTFYMLA